MPTVSFDDVLGLDDEFDPLMADDLEIDQEDMDDDNPLDTVDYPTMRNMPQSMQREAVYTPKPVSYTHLFPLSLRRPR